MKKSLAERSTAERHAMITQARHTHPALSVRQLCALFAVNRAWYYARPRLAGQAARAVAVREAIARRVLASPGYGYRRVTKALHRGGWPITHTRGLLSRRQASLLCQLQRHFDDRHLLHGILLVLKAGCPWDDVLLAYGAPTTGCRRFQA